MSNQPQHQALEAIETLPEAGGVAWTDLYSTKTGAKISLTSRAANPTDALDELYAAIKYAMDKYGMTTEFVSNTVKPSSNGSANGKASEAAPQTQSQRTAATSAPTVEGEADSRGNVPGAQKSMEIGAIEITPVAGAKAKLAMFPVLDNGNVGQYASLFETRTVSDWEQVIEVDFGAPLFDAGLLTVANKVTIQPPIFAHYDVSSNQTRNGNYYLNFRYFSNEF